MIERLPDDDQPPEEDTPPSLILPVDPRPLEERWPTLAAFEKELLEEAITLDEWAEMQIDTEE